MVLRQQRADRAWTTRGAAFGLGSESRARRDGPARAPRSQRAATRPAPRGARRCRVRGRCTAPSSPRSGTRRRTRCRRAGGGAGPRRALAQRASVASDVVGVSGSHRRRPLHRERSRCATLLVFARKLRAKLEPGGHAAPDAHAYVPTARPRARRRPTRPPRAPGAGIAQPGAASASASAACASAATPKSAASERAGRARAARRRRDAAAAPGEHADADDAGVERADLRPRSRRSARARRRRTPATRRSRPAVPHRAASSVRSPRWPNGCSRPRARRTAGSQRQGPATRARRPPGAAQQQPGSPVTRPSLPPRWLGGASRRRRERHQAQGRAGGRANWSRLSCGEEHRHSSSSRTAAARARRAPATLQAQVAPVDGARASRVAQRGFPLAASKLTMSPPARGRRRSRALARCHPKLDALLALLPSEK